MEEARMPISQLVRDDIRNCRVYSAPGQQKLRCAHILNDSTDKVFRAVRMIPEEMSVVVAISRCTPLPINPGTHNLMAKVTQNRWRRESVVYSGYSIYTSLSLSLHVLKVYPCFLVVMRSAEFVQGNLTVQGHLVTSMCIWGRILVQQ